MQLVQIQIIARVGVASQHYSAPKMKQEKLVAVFSHNKSKGASNRKNLTYSVWDAHWRKGHSATSKKARGERVKIEKENSHSSVESDFRSSNFVFVQGTCSTSNIIQSERPLDSDGENGDEAQCSDREVNDGALYGYIGDNLGGHEDISPDVVAASSWENKEERSNNHSSSTNGDLLETFFALQSLQKALETEVLKFKEIKDVPIDESILDTPPGEGVQKSEVVEPENGDVDKQLEDMFKQKIEAGVKFLILSRTVQQLRSAAADQQLPVSEEPKVLDSDLTQLNKIDESENVNDVIAIADETLKLQKRVCKYTVCFFVQLVLLVFILAVFILQLSPNYMEVVPT